MKRIAQLFASKFEAKRMRIHFIKQKNAHRSERCRLELDGFHWLHHLEEGGSSICKIVHHSVFSVLTEGGF